MTSSRSDLPANVEFEPEFIAALCDIYEQKILFNQWMGLKVESVKATGIVASLAMKPELVGHFAY
ncbi:MAG: thioesterase family protein, partial [Betaproteobacteria bacterium]|nr:thioesterase family protein [Betaproteobacteria bacterium]